MVWQQIIIGPQLVGVILFIIGLIMSRFPPKKINNYYGYRMPSAMKSQETWDEANLYSAKYMIKAGFITIAFGIVIILLLATMQLPGNIRALISIMSMMASGTAPALFLIVATEKHLTKTFGD